MLRHQRAVLALLPLVLAGCPRVPLDFGRDGEAHTAEELLKRTELVESQVINLKGDGRLSVDTPQGKGSVSLFIGVLHPSFIHIEQLDFFGKPQGVLVTDGKTFGLYDAAQAKYFHGPATPLNLGRFLPLVMEPSELAALMLGRAPRIPYDSSTFMLDQDKRVYVVTLTKANVTQYLEIDPRSARVLKSRIEGASTYDAEFGDVTEIKGVYYPKHVTIDAKLQKTHVELFTKDIELNEAPDLTLFEMAAPEGVPSTEVDENGDLRSMP